MARVTVRTRGKIVVDTTKVERLLPALIVGHVLNRTHEGKGVDGQPFAGYSAAYRGSLARMGEGPGVDLRLTGGLLNSLRHLRTEKGGTVTTMWFGPGTGSSPQVRAKAGAAKRVERATKKRARDMRTAGNISEHTRAAAEAAVQERYERSIARARRSSRTGKRGPSWNLVGLWIHKGTARMKARPWLGLGREGENLVARAIEKAGIFRS